MRAQLNSAPMLLIAASLLSGACQRDPGTSMPISESVDPHSFAVPAEARVTHVHLNLDADFAAKRLSGNADLTISRKAGNTIVLDTKDLNIESVSDSLGNPLLFELGAIDSIRGQPLEIQLNPATTFIRIRYATQPGAAALQ